MWTSVSITEHVHEVAGDEACKEDDPHDHDAPEQGALALGALGPEVDQDHAHAVEGVEEDRADEADLAEAEPDSLVVPDHIDVGLGGDADESGVQAVHEMEQEDEHPLESLGVPCPSTLDTAPV